MDGVIYEKVRISDTEAYWAVRSCKSHDANIIIDAEIDGLPVKGIMPYAFRFKTTLEQICIPDTIEYIGEFAFLGCKSLKQVIISVSNFENKEDWLTLHEACFKDCESLTSIVGDKVMDFYGTRVFMNCKNIKYFGYNNQIIGNLQASTFQGCLNLKSIHLIDRSCHLASGCILGCTNLEIIRIDCRNVTYAKSVLSILAKKHIICSSNCSLTNLAYEGFNIEII